MVEAIEEITQRRFTVEECHRMAEAGIPECWIVNLVAGVLEVSREPSAGEYRSETAHDPGSRISPLAWPDLEIEVSALIPSPGKM